MAKDQKVVRASGKKRIAWGIGLLLFSNAILWSRVASVYPFCRDGVRAKATVLGVVGSRSQGPDAGPAELYAIAYDGHFSDVVFHSVQKVSPGMLIDVTYLPKDPEGRVMEGRCSRSVWAEAEGGGLLIELTVAQHVLAIWLVGSGWFRLRAGRRGSDAGSKSAAEGG